MEALGREFNVIPIAAGRGIDIKDCQSIAFVCTGADTFTVTSSATFGGSYTSPGNILTKKYTNTATNGSAAWVAGAVSPAAAAVIVASGAVVFEVPAVSLPAGHRFVKVAAGASGLVTAIAHGLTIQRKPGNLPALSA